MSKRRQTFCRTDIMRAIKAVRDSGLSVSAVRMSAQGQIEVETKSEVERITGVAINGNPWDEVLNHDDRH
jgi:hypothetical protein